MSVSTEAIKIYGYMLIGCAVASTAVLLLHPVLPANGAGSLVDAVSGVRGQSFLVHAAAIIFGIVELTCFCGFALMLGVGRPLVLGGLVAWAVGTLALITAAAINGFAVPYLAASVARGSPDQAQAFQSLLRFAWSLNQAWDKIGLLSWAAAVCSWSLFLVTYGGWSRLLGLMGVLIGTGIALTIANGWVAMGATGFVLTTTVFSIWTLGIGLLMVTGGKMSLHEARAGTSASGATI
jgi:hypothetical protein